MNPTRFDWKRYPEAEAFFLGGLDIFLKAHQVAARLEQKIREHTSTRLIDWVDHVVLPDSGPTRTRLARMGFIPDPLGEAPPGRIAFLHAGAIFPNVVLQWGMSGLSIFELALKVESVADFVARQGIDHPLEGPPKSRYRRALVAREGGLGLLAVERRAYRGYLCETPPPAYYQEYLRAEELWRTRPRRFDDAVEGFRKTEEILEDISTRLGKGLSAHVLFEGERRYWQERNRAARLQKERQDSLGLGWANHDHHTFRCSRSHLHDLVRLLEGLGFQCRERFYAGEEAGWGAQVMENHLLGITVFADLDLSPDETEEDFAHRPLYPRKELGTVGLWVALHGESFFEAGMHHLAIRADFDALRRGMAQEGVQTMKPFSDFPFLRQAFTQGEQWKVRPDRIDQLLSLGSINQEQYQKFSSQGAIGSHLEDIERREGFKGFNQRSVSAIIQATDPRAYHR
ncbi:MAG TPA: hypothetical protein ACFYEA_03310 [Candidatus Tripitaka californicus]|uniref:hypothetical protein n=1 Tax=Candidatus Tripitaka californicus TaxID=3367616 RepID=UPI004029D123|nr:hypothetical protein [Planctomycetota bacterium]